MTQILPQPGFQNAPISLQPALGVGGDFWGVNPRASVNAGQATLVAPASGIAVGNFAFITPGTYVVSQSWASGNFIGFMGRRMAQGLITNYLGQSATLVQGGFGITLFSQGDFFVQVLGGSTAGQVVYADAITGGAISAASAPGAASVTGTIGAAGWTGVTVAGVLTISGSGTGIISVGDTVTGTGVAANTTIVSLGTGTGGTGTYNLGTNGVANTTLAFGSAANIGTLSNVLNVSAVGSGTLVAGTSLNNASLAAGTTIASQSTGSAGGTGKYVVTGVQQLLASGTLTVTAPVATNWKFVNTVPAGSVAKMTSWGA